MSRAKKLTPSILKRIILEEKRNLRRESTLNRRRTSPTLKTLDDKVAYAKKLRLAEQKLTRQLKKVRAQKAVIKKKISEEF